MRILVALAVCLALALAGLICFVVMNEHSRDLSAGNGSAAGGLSGDAKTATISNGEQVDVNLHVSLDGYTVVMFTADW